MANRFIGGVLSSQQPSSGGFVSRASTGTYFNNTGTLVTAPINQPRLNYSFNGNPAANRYSNYFNGSSYLTVGTSATISTVYNGNFTFEAWYFLTAYPASDSSINDSRPTSTDGNYFMLGVRASTGAPFIYINSAYKINGTQPALNTWVHVAYVKSGTTGTLYQNGTSVGTWSDTTSYVSPQGLNIGTHQAGGSKLTGYISNIRLTSSAVYTGTFTPPPNPLALTQNSSTNISAISSGVAFLSCQSGGIADLSSNNFAITNTGVTTSTFIPTTFTPDLTTGTGWYNPAVLIEPSATNLIQYSTAFTNAYWTPYNNSGAILTVTANTAIAPDGTLTASTITGGATAGFKVIGPGLVTSWQVFSGANTWSFFVKAGTATYVTTWAGGSGTSDFATYNLINGSLLASSMGTGSSTNILNVGNGWWRVTWTFAVYIVSGNLSPIIGLADSSVITRAGSTSSTGSLYIWGAQFEQGSTATSYIPTSGATVTRSQDDVGPLGSGIYTLMALENQTSIDDQATVQTYTSVGSSTWTCPVDVTSVEVLVVAGGGGGGSNGAGGGAGGAVYNTSYPVVPGTTYPIIIGSGGAGGNANTAGISGTNSQFSNLIAIGGGGGGSGGGTPAIGRSGGSGGGSAAPGSVSINPSGSGISGQGNSGGSSGVGGTTPYAAGGGGGAGGPGSNGSSTSTGIGGAGGPGLAFIISGTSTYYASGGGGAGYSVGATGIASAGGGGNAGTTGSNATANTGGGGGGSLYGASGNQAGNGGSGIVIVKYIRTNTRLTATSNSAIVTQRFSTTVSSGWTAPAGVTSVEVLVVAGGGSGGGGGGKGGGGGAGGLVYNSAYTVTPGSSYTVTVGAGGTSATNAVGNNGSNSIFATLTATGGGGGGGGSATGSNLNGLTGGSGGGAGAYGGSAGTGGSGTSSQGNIGGSATVSVETTGGGGGAGSAGVSGSASTKYSGAGGPGLPYSITGNLEYYAGGGGGSTDNAATSLGYPATGQGGIGGGGAGEYYNSGRVSAPQAGGANTGGGGGGSITSSLASAAGGSGVIIIRYRVPTVATFLDSGSWTCPAGVTSVQALVVAGGGGGGSHSGADKGGGGGGAGGLLYSSSVAVTPGVTYPIVVGQGGAGGASGSNAPGFNGQNSSFVNLIAIGGGGGAQGIGGGPYAGVSGGSGGGGVADGVGSNGAPGAGTYGQGNSSSANTSTNNSAGGGGAGGAGGGNTASTGGAGGAGLTYTISGTSTTYAGGGGGGAYSGTSGLGGSGGGGNAGAQGGNAGSSGTATTGGGGGGAGGGGSSSSAGGNGGSGIVIIRYYGG